jgi:hypothetical protein
LNVLSDGFGSNIPIVSGGETHYPSAVAAG